MPQSQKSNRVYSVHDYWNVFATSSHVFSIKVIEPHLTTVQRRYNAIYSLNNSHKNPKDTTIRPLGRGMKSLSRFNISLIIQLP